MRVAHVADLHIDDRAPNATLNEQVETLSWIGSHAHEAGAKAMLVAGDVFHRTSTPLERNAAIEVFVRWANNMPVIIVYGNHDQPYDLDFLASLLTRHQITVVDRPAPLVICDGRLEIACLPWPRKANLVADADITSALDVQQVSASAMRAVLSGFSQGFSGSDATRILLGHAELGTALADSGQPLAGRCDIELGEHDLLEVGADMVLLGHIHKHQILRDSIVYAGSPRQMTFGEDPVKGYCLVEVSRGAQPVITHVKAPGRELVTIEACWPIEGSPAGHAGKLVSENDVPVEDEPAPKGAAIRLQYSISETNRHAAGEQATEAKRRWLDAGAHSVKIDARTIATHRVRSEDIDTALSTADKLRSLWTHRGKSPDRSEAILAKLTQIEGEVSP
jgi:exonuclease SbcD